LRHLVVGNLPLNSDALRSIPDNPQLDVRPFTKDPRHGTDGGNMVLDTVESRHLRNYELVRGHSEFLTRRCLALKSSAIRQLNAIVDYLDSWRRNSFIFDERSAYRLSNGHYTVPAAQHDSIEPDSLNISTVRIKPAVFVKQHRWPTADNTA
jgi:hypothetical protein